MASTVAVPTDAPTSESSTVAGVPLSEDETTSINIALIVLITAACLIVLLTVAIGYILCTRRKRGQHLRLDELYLNNPPNTYMTPESFQADAEPGQFRQLGVENFSGDNPNPNNRHVLMVSPPGTGDGSHTLPRRLPNLPAVSLAQEGSSSTLDPRLPTGATATPGVSGTGKASDDPDGVYEYIASPTRLKFFSGVNLPNNNYINTSSPKPLSASQGVLWSKENEGLLYMNMPHSRKGSVDLICEKPSALYMRDGLDDADINHSRSVGSSANSSLGRRANRPSATKALDSQKSSPGNEIYLDMSKSSIDIRDLSDAGYASVTPSTPVRSRKPSGEGQEYLDMSSNGRDVREPDNKEYTYIPSDGKTAVRQSECVYVPPEYLRKDRELFEPEYSSIPSAVEAEREIDPEYASIPESASARLKQGISGAMYENVDDGLTRESPAECENNRTDITAGFLNSKSPTSPNTDENTTQDITEEPMYESIPSHPDTYCLPSDSTSTINSTPSTPLESGYDRALDVRPESVSDTSNYYEDVDTHRANRSSNKPGRPCRRSSSHSDSSSGRGSASGSEYETPKVMVPQMTEATKPELDKASIPPVPTKRVKDKVINNTNKPAPKGKPPRAGSIKLDIPPIPSPRKLSPSRPDTNTRASNIPSIPTRRKPKLSLPTQSDAIVVQENDAHTESVA